MIHLFPRAQLLFREAPHISLRRRILRPLSTGKPSPPTPPPSPTTNHHDLKSFLLHAERTSLSPQSTVYIGTRYEYTIAESLRRYRLSLTRIGGRADSGIDLLGTWNLPSLPHPLRVIVQCKALKTKLGPNIIRELEGTFVGAPVGWRGDGILGMLVSPREATKGVRDSLARSPFPLVWVMAELDGEIKQILWNSKASSVGLEGVDVQVKYGADADPSKRTLALAYDGEELEPLDGNDYQECKT
ncbi:hypothetical protein VTO42DRAFT_6653 [Malbranchea cinnamomea]